MKKAFIFTGWLIIQSLLCFGNNSALEGIALHSAAIYQSNYENLEEGFSATFIVFAGQEPTSNAVITLAGVTNAQGDYIFTNVLPGTWNYSIIHDDFLPDEGEITITDQDLTIEITLSPGIPEIIVSPTFIEEYEYYGSIKIVPMTISNAGSANLSYYIHIDPVRNMGHPDFPFGENIMILPGVYGDPGNDILIEIEVSNDDEFVAFQVDVPLPEGFAYRPGSLALNPARKADHILQGAVLPGTNTLRTLAFSLTNSTFFGNSGTIFTFSLSTPDTPEATYPLNLVGAILADDTGANILTGTMNGYISFSGFPHGNYLILGNISGNTGSALPVNITINNIDEFVGFQFDVDLPEGFGFIHGSATLNNERRVDHQIQVEPIGDFNDIRITAFSPGNNSFLGNSGYVATIMVEPIQVPGNYTFPVNDAYIFDFAGNNILNGTVDGTIKLTKGWLSVSPLQGIVEPDATHELDVIIHPEYCFTWEHTATIEIFSNDPAHPLVTVGVWVFFLINSVGEAEADHVLVYPVPARDVLNIRVGKNTSSIRIFNLMGQMAWEGLVKESTEMVVDLKPFEPGIYLLQLVLRDGSTQSRRIVISK